MQDLLHSRYRDPAWIAAFISIFVSIWIISLNDVINSDGVLYIEVAEKILRGEWSASIRQYSWPFYSLLIALTSKITFLDLETSAALVNVCIQALLTFMFVRCAQALGGDKRIALFAAILILTNIKLGGYRDLIIRDFGYWAFFFTALYYFLQYHQTRITRYAIGFSLAMIVATLFRIEGMVFLLIAPLLFLFEQQPLKKNIHSIVWLLSPVIVVVISGLIISLASGNAIEFVGRIGDPVIYAESAYQNLLSGIAEKGRFLEQHVLLENSRNLGTESMFAILFMVLVLKMISATGYVALFFSASAYLSNKIKTSIQSLNIINGFMIINLIILIVFVLSHHFLSSRYTMTMGLLLTLPAAFALSDFLQKRDGDSSWNKRGKVLVIILLVYMFLDTITSFGASKSYIKDAGLWINQHVAEDARLLTNGRLLYYYAKRPLDMDAISSVINAKSSEQLDINKDQYDYLAIKIRRKQVGYKDNLIKWLGSEPVYTTSNKRGDSVVIFKLKK